MLRTWVNTDYLLPSLLILLLLLLLLFLLLLLLSFLFPPSQTPPVTRDAETEDVIALCLCLSCPCFSHFKGRGRQLLIVLGFTACCTPNSALSCRRVLDIKLIPPSAPQYKDACSAKPRYKPTFLVPHDQNKDDDEDYAAAHCRHDNGLPVASWWGGATARAYKGAATPQ